MRGERAKNVVQQSHALGQIRFGENPTAAQTTQAVAFRQTTGRDELRAEVNRGSRRVFEHRFEIDFVYQHPRAGVGGDLADAAQRWFIGQSAAWIMEVSQ